MPKCSALGCENYREDKIGNHEEYIALDKDIFKLELEKRINEIR
ncbi:MAG: hypothetical protein ACLKAK_05430 [Alkaliphilus sp.]